ncbi:Uma2 family endonuclease [Deinococcus detaillensis]|uniref:Uma2 family endonuclease n=1 Tax=Deinococcus detaillensis TaxID=2592048 RepID=A0A553V1S3_9DEIO|nr:Uma2 family endonuclease [Deinococcus detaillensis]TSA86423.1 Uma2 family endonuclease [Deinococcus detaillensis]
MTQKALSVEDYLRTEELSPVKREYVGGFVYPLHGAARAQAGTSKNHVTITGNIHYALTLASRRAGCRLSASDMKLRIEDSNAFYSPDVMVACGPDNGEAYFETEPCLLVEVLSKGTASVDRHAKYQAYTAIPSLQTYLIVEQNERRVYAYGRSVKQWQLSELVGQADIALPCLNRSLSLDEIYCGVLEG